MAKTLKSNWLTICLGFLLSTTVTLFCFTMINHHEWAQSFENLNAELEHLKVKTKLYESIVIPDTIQNLNLRIKRSAHEKEAHPELLRAIRKTCDIYLRKYGAPDFTVPRGTVRSRERHGSFRDERHLAKMEDTNYIRDPTGPIDYVGQPGRHGPPGVNGYQGGRSDVKEVEASIRRRYNSVYSKPKIVKEMKGVSARLNSTATFVCETSGTPKPEISWKVNGQFSNEIPNAEVIQEKMLRLQRVKKSNEGAVECIARNSLGQDRQTVNLTVLVPPSVFVTPKQALVYEDGKVFTANCTSAGFPKPTVTWVTTHQEQAIETSKDGGTLILRKPKTTDSGTYKCIAKNSIGISYGFSFLVVIKVVRVCEKNPCRNGGACRVIGKKFKCNCKNGYTGKTCEIDMFEHSSKCRRSPCFNQGTCIETTNSYKCNCRKGFTGRNCQTDIDECASSPCLYGGKCVDSVNNFQCICRPGYFGATCNIDFDTVFMHH